MKQYFLGKYSLSPFFVLSLTFGNTQSYAEDFYKWVDANGSTHYTLTPPPANLKTKTKKIETRGWRAPSNPSALPAPTQSNEAQTSAPQSNLPQSVNTAPNLPTSNPTNAPVNTSNPTQTTPSVVNTNQGNTSKTTTVQIAN